MIHKAYDGTRATTKEIPASNPALPIPAKKSRKRKRADSAITTPTPGFFERMGEYIAAYVRVHGRPHLNMYANLDSWEDTAPTFGFWPCAANPGGDTTPFETLMDNGEKPTNISTYLLCVDVNGSKKIPNYVGNYEYPNTSINSNFAHCKRYFDERHNSGLRAPELYLPGPGISHMMPLLTDIPNVSVSALYMLSIKYPSVTVLTGLDMHLCSRFDAGTTDKITHNAHLIEAPLPREWVDGKQFGDAREKKRRRKGAKK